MSSRLARSLSTGFTAAALLNPSLALAQESPAAESTGPNSALFASCAARLRDEDGFVVRVVAVLAMPDREQVEAALVAMEPAARKAVEEEPGNAEARYHLAVILGGRTDRAEGLSQVRIASELHAVIQRTLELDPEHAGAHHLLGRLHAAVMRMGRIQRFLVTKVLGGSTLSDASWDEAQKHLEAAEAGDPCIPDHHYELARLYLDRGRWGDAREELAHVLILTENADNCWSRIRSGAAALQAELERGFLRDAHGSPPIAVGLGIEAEVGLRGAVGRGEVWRCGGQTEVTEDGLNGLGLGEDSEDPHVGAAVGALEGEYRDMRARRRARRSGGGLLDMRRALQDGQTPRRLQEKATRRSAAQASQPTRAISWARMPHSRYARNGERGADQ